MDDKLKKIIEKHEKWMKDQYGGECANLCGADLCDVDLHGADLCGADLRDVDLCGANLHGADLCGADLCGANLHGANLSRANLCDVNLHGAYLCGANLHCADLSRANLRDVDLCGANLHGADLHGANLSRANLCGANLHGAYLCGADLCGADLCNADLRVVGLCGANLFGAKNVPIIPMSCPDSGSFTAWKKANGMIVKLLIPEDARRSSATGRKCRCDKAVVLAIETVDGEPAEVQSVCSDYSQDFVYEVGKTVTVSDFCGDRFKECGEGIHFFINRHEAVEYN